MVAFPRHGWARRMQSIATCGYRSWDISNVLHCTAHLAWFVQQNERTPHTVQLLDRAVRECLRAQQVRSTTRLLCHLTEAPREGVCDSNDPVFLQALRHGVYGLSRMSLSQTSKANHPALGLATLYDHCSTNNMDLACTILSSIISTLSQHLQGRPLLQLLEVIARDFQVREPPDDAASVLSALIIAYGRAGRPEMGEQFLRHYSLHHGSSVTARSLSMTNRPQYMEWLRRYTKRPLYPVDVPWHFSWASYTDVWNALIRSRCIAGDITTARIWLEQYRMITSIPATTLDLHKIPRPVASASPYLTLMHALSSTSGIRKLFAGVSPVEAEILRAQASEVASPYKTAAIYQILELVRQDQIIPGVSMLNFLASFEIGCGRVERATAFVQEALTLESGPAFVVRRVHTPSEVATTMQHGMRVHISTIPVLFALCAATAQKHLDRSDLRPNPCRLWDSDEPVLAGLATPRQILCKALQLVNKTGSPRQQRFKDKWLASKGTHMLNQGLEAMLTTNDFAGAWYILQLYATWGKKPDAWTHSYLWKRLAALRNTTLSLGDEPAKDDLVFASERMEACIAEQAKQTWPERERPSWMKTQPVPSTTEAWIQAAKDDMVCAMQYIEERVS